MTRFYSLLLLIGGIAAAWLVLPQLYSLSRGNLPVRRLGAPSPQSSGTVSEPSVILPPAKNQKAFRLVVWDLTPLDQMKVLQPGVLTAIATVVRQFDLTVLQGVDLRDRSVLAQLLDQVDSKNETFHYVTVPEPLRLVSRRGTVIIFDMRALEVDRRTVQVVEDPQRRFQIPPLVAAFRARGLPPGRAFTFSLVSLHIDAFQAEEELSLLDDVLRAVRDDGRGEDDVIIAGNFARDYRVIAAALGVPDGTCAIMGLPTNVLGTESSQNIVFDGRATIEYTGRRGVFDLLRQFQLTAAQAQQIGDHLPVWAEFSVCEGGGT
ncbi:MAG: hypothetical protein ACUVQG_03960 [Thermogutta sp.]